MTWEPFKNGKTKCWLCCRHQQQQIERERERESNQYNELMFTLLGNFCVKMDQRDNEWTEPKTMCITHNRWKKVDNISKAGVINCISWALVPFGKRASAISILNSLWFEQRPRFIQRTNVIARSTCIVLFENALFRCSTFVTYTRTFVWYSEYILIAHTTIFTQMPTVILLIKWVSQLLLHTHIHSFHSHKNLSKINQRAYVAFWIRWFERISLFRIGRLWMYVFRI